MMPSDAAFPGAANTGRPVANSPTVLSGNDDEVLRFVAEMYAMQMDQLAALLTDRGGPADKAASLARGMVARWRAAGYTESKQLSLGEPWVWATRKGLNACGLGTRLVTPTARNLRHTHAVTDVRLAVQRATVWREGRAWWRSERLIWSGLEYSVSTQHVPDGEVHWPAESGLPWAGEVWAMEVEISRKTVAQSAKIMREALTQTGDARGVPSGAPVPGLAPRYARLVYVCAPTSVQRLLNARAEVGSPLSARIDIYDLPASAMRFDSLKRGRQS